MCENHEPKPVDEQPEAEIRGGNRREDYMPGKPVDLLGDDLIVSTEVGADGYATGPDNIGKNWDGTPVAHEDSDLEDGAESYGDDATD
jgi:hypothetical protein